jgi:hypothetical protein
MNCKAFNFTRSGEFSLAVSYLSISLQKSRLPLSFYLAFSIIYSSSGTFACHFFGTVKQTRNNDKNFEEREGTQMAT